MCSDVIHDIIYITFNSINNILLYLCVQNYIYQNYWLNNVVDIENIKHFVVATRHYPIIITHYDVAITNSLSE